MELKELEKIKKYSTEADLIKIVEEINNKVIFKWYNSQQISALINEIMKIDLLSVKYKTREAILYLLCDIVAYYGFFDDANWESIINIRDNLEDDLKEYVAEILESM